jgi:urate oxidase
MKTSQSSFTNFCKDEYTTLPEVSDRLVGTIVTANWTYSGCARRVNRNYIHEYDNVRKALLDAFAGPSDVGTASPAVQFTCFQMGEAVLARCPEVEEIKLNMPNVHNLPLDQSKFGLKNIHPHGEIFVPVDEPHGIIEATIVRQPKARL